MNGSSPKILDGVRVLDFGVFFAGPFGARLLADLGADVIKVENTSGDAMRPLTRVFSAAQRGKRTIAVDMKTPEGREIIARLVAKSDVLMHNLRPGVAERLDIGYDQVSAVNPNLVYVYCPGWGSDGPDAQRQGFAFMFLGLAGLQFEVAGAGNPPALPIGNEDTANGLLAAFGAVSGLFMQRRTGTGCYVESPQLNSALFLSMHMFRDARSGEVRGTRGLDGDQSGTSALERLYRTQDGWICIAAGEQLKPTVDALMGVGNHGTTSESERLELYGRAFAGEPTDSWIRRLESAGVPCASPMLDGGSATLRDPENLELGRVEAYEHPEYGSLLEIAQLVRFSSSGGGPSHASPVFAEHTHDILAELGYDETAIEAFRRGGIVEMANSPT